MIRTTDTDVVVLAVANIIIFTIQVTELWITFGTGKNFRNIPAHSPTARRR